MRTLRLTWLTPEMGEARNRFHGGELAQKHGLVYEDLLRKFLRGYTCPHIARALDLKTHQVDYLREEYFSMLGNAKKIQAARARRLRKLRLQRLARRVPPDRSKLGVVAAAATTAGCKVELVFRALQGKPERAEKVLTINGQLCGIYDLRSRLKKPAVQIRRSTAHTVSAFIFIGRDDWGRTRIFVVPASLLRSSKGGTKGVYFNEPMKKRCPKAGVCVCGYENAWWVLGQLK